MDWIRERGFKLAVASSTNIEQVTKILTMNHVAERLELMVSGGMFKRSKRIRKSIFIRQRNWG